MLFALIAIVSLASAQDATYSDVVLVGMAQDLTTRCEGIAGSPLTTAEVGLDRPFANRAKLLEQVENSRRTVALNYETCLTAQGAVYAQTRVADAASTRIEAGGSVDLRTRKGAELDVKTEDADRPHQGYGVSRARQLTIGTVLDAKARLNGGRTPRMAEDGNVAPAPKAAVSAAELEQRKLAAEEAKLVAEEAWLKANTSGS